MKVWQKNLILIVLVVLLAALPLWLLPNAEFGGADGQAEEVILELQPDYEPWFWSRSGAGQRRGGVPPLRPPGRHRRGVVGFVLGPHHQKAGKEGSGLMGTDRYAYQSRLRRISPMPKLLLTARRWCSACSATA